MEQLLSASWKISAEPHHTSKKLKCLTSLLSIDVEAKESENVVRASIPSRKIVLVVSSSLARMIPTAAKHAYFPIPATGGQRKG